MGAELRVRILLKEIIQLIKDLPYSFNKIMMGLFFGKKFSILKEQTCLSMNAK